MSSDNDLKARFVGIYGREPWPEKLNRLYEIMRHCKITQDDPMVDVVMMLDSTAELMTQGIKDAKAAAVADAVAIQKRVEEAAAKTATAAAIANVEKAAPITAQKAVGRSFLRWACASAAVLVLAFLAVGWFAYNKGVETGRAQSNAAEKWASTEQGQLAYSLWQQGDLGHLANCDRPGWKRESKGKWAVCYPMDDAKGQRWGWAVPK